MHERDSTTEAANADAQAEARSESARSTPTWVCSSCGLKLPVTTSTCPQDDTPQDVAEQLKDLLSSNYEFIGTIGTGGMSVIYKARQALLDKVVAIKMLHSHLLNEPSIMRFQQEAKAASRLKHPNVIAVHDFGVTKLGQPYMVMDFIDGKTLADLIKERGAVPLPEAMDIFLAVVDALEHAHEHNLLHRDLKPSNIMLRETIDGFQVFLVDFGIAKILDRDSSAAHQLTLTGELMGSPLYMSPEQCMGKKVDQRSDIYSLGCVLYEAVVGVPPHRGDTMLETIFKHLNEVAIPLHEVRSDIIFPDAFEALVMKLLETKPEDRVQTVSEVKARLKSIQSGALAGTVAAKKTDPIFKISKLAIIYCVCAVVFLFGLVSLVVADQKSREAVQTQQDADAKVADIENERDSALAKLKNTVVNVPTFESLSAQPSTTEQIFLAKTSVTDQALQGLGHLRHLRELDLNSTRTSDAVVAVLTQLRSLQTLSLRATRISGAGLGKLSSLNNLTFLNIDDSNADDQTLLEISKLPSLAILGVSNSKITDKGISYLKNLKDLVKLDINGTRITNAGMKSLGQMKLTNLAMWDTDVTPGGVEQLCLCKTLRLLFLSHLELSQGDLEGISKQRDLRILQLKGVKNLKDDDLRYFVNLKSLQDLRIEDCPLITDNCATYLAQMPNLVSLRLNRVNITSKAIAKLGDLKKLKSLSLQNTQIDDVGMKALAQFPLLEDLLVEGTNISDVGVKALDSLPKLRKLGAGYCPNITLQSMVGFSKAHHGAVVLSQYDDLVYSTP